MIGGEGTKGGEPEEAPSLCVPRFSGSGEPDAQATLERCAQAGGYVLSHLPLCFCVPFLVCVKRVGGKGGVQGSWTTSCFNFSRTLAGEQEREDILPCLSLSRTWPPSSRTDFVPHCLPSPTRSQA